MISALSKQNVNDTRNLTWQRIPAMMQHLNFLVSNDRNYFMSTSYKYLNKYV